MFLVVEFTDNKEIAIVPDVWLEGNSCCQWPTNIRDPSRLVIKMQEPGENWPSFPIKELYRSESYVTARSKLKLAEVQSDINTCVDSSEEEDDCRRSKRKRRPTVLTSDEEEMEVPVVERTEKSHSLMKKVPTPPRPTLPDRMLSLSSSRGAVTEPLLSPSTDVNENSRSALARDIRIFTMLEKLSQKQDVLQDSLNNVIRMMKNMSAMSMSSEQSGSSSLPEDISFPINDLDEMEKFECALQEEETFKAVVNNLSFIGGVGKTDTTRRVMRECLAQTMAIKYNWYGHKGKQAFGKLRLSVAVQKAVSKSCRCTSAEVEICVREWLRTATDREGGRKKRREKANQN